MLGAAGDGGEVTMEKHGTRPLIAITMGDPAGIGAEVSLKALLEPETYAMCRPLVLGTLSILAHIQGVLGSGQSLRPVANPAEGRYTPGSVDVLDLSAEHPGPFPLGIATREGGAAAVAYVEKAIALAMAGEVEAIATAPINKEAMRAAGFPYDGHTELLAHQTGTKAYTMMLASGNFRVFHVSTHVSLRGAIDRAKKARVLQVIELAYREIQRLGVAEPHVAVAGLNPHAGEHGLFGDEDRHEIAPAVEEARARGWHVSGPWPPDTVFARARRGDFDGVVAMYHDQGHIPFKMTEFDLGVNVTVGLPIIRTSVDHGTAYDIAGTGVANPKNMVQAIQLAADMARRRMPSPQPSPTGRGSERVQA
jgi:4-phospho-D-threonate 3-dehydrogenase / 4-phospho-D-erythronate 3-dehydrogenase